MSEHEHNTTAEQAEKPSPSAALNLPHLKAPHFRDEEVKFSFKKRKAEGVDAGQEPEKRAPVILTLPVLTFDGLVESMKDEKVVNLVLDSVNDLIREAARQQINDDDKPVNRQDELDLSKLNITFIANQPKSERTGGGISKETWEAFEQDYVEVMPAASGKSKERVEKAAKLFVARLNPVKSEKTVLKFLQEQLALWASTTPNAEDFTEVFQFLDNKITNLLNRDSQELLAAL